MLKMQKMQKLLDDNIVKNNNVEGMNLFERKVISLDIELSEFFNEVESWKYWKKHKGKDNIIGEASDALHFILSLANDLKYELVKPTNLIRKPNMLINDSENWIDHSLITRYMGKIKKHLWVDFNTSKDPFILNVIFKEMIKILNILGYTFKDLENAYIKKNKINFERQKGDY